MRDQASSMLIKHQELMYTPMHASTQETCTGACAREYSHAVSSNVYVHAPFTPSKGNEPALKGSTMAGG